MSDNAEASSPASSTSKPPRPLLFPSRIILLALLAVAVVGLIVDQMARKSAQAAFDAVNEKMGEEKKLNEVTREEVHQAIGREPDEDDDPDDLFEVFSWQGALRKQRVFVHYRPGKKSLLKDVSLNNAPPGFPE